MTNDLKDILYAISLDEYKNATAGETKPPKDFYARSGRFIIERRRIAAIETGKPDTPITVRMHPVNLPFPEHSHDFIEIMLCFSGEITHIVGKTRVTVAEGDVLILGTDAIHSIEPAKKSDLGINVIICKDLYQRLVLDMRGLDLPDTNEMLDMLAGGEYLHFKCGDSLAQKSAIEVLIRTALIEKGAATSLYPALLLVLTLAAGKIQNGTPDFEARLNAYLNTSYSTATLSEAAELFSLSPAYLSRLIAARYGENFKSLLMRVRFNRALELLKQTDMPIGEVIESVGYENNSYFHKEFKRRFNVTPGTYRREYK